MRGLREGEKFIRHESSEIGSGKSSRVGVTYRMTDSSLVYVSESDVVP